jgi:hypothetical protein
MGIHNGVLSPEVTRQAGMTKNCKVFAGQHTIKKKKMHTNMLSDFMRETQMKSVDKIMGICL